MGVAARDPVVTTYDGPLIRTKRSAGLIDLGADGLDVVAGLVYELADIDYADIGVFGDRCCRPRAKQWGDPADGHLMFSAGTNVSVRLRKYHPGRIGGRVVKCSPPSEWRSNRSGSLKPLRPAGTRG